MTFDREQIRNWIAEATGEGVSVDDALPDTLAAAAEVLGLTPPELRLWVFDHCVVTLLGVPAGVAVTPDTWSAAALAQWARRYGFGREVSA